MNLRTRLQRLEQSVEPSPTAGLKPWPATAEEFVTEVIHAFDETRSPNGERISS